jgi:ATP-binding cassette subfamily B protein
METLKSVMEKSYNYFLNHLSGNIAGKIYMLQDRVINFMEVFSCLVLPASISLILAVGMFCHVKMEIAFALFFWLVLHLLSCVYMGGMCTKYEENHAHDVNVLNGSIIDSIANHLSWRVFSNKKLEYSTIEKYQTYEIKTFRASMLYVAKLRSVLSFLTVVLGLGGINALSYYYWKCNDISIGNFVFIINSTLNIIMISWTLGIQLPNIFKDIGSCKQAFSVIEEKSNVNDVIGAKDITVSKGTISFKNVSFGYGDNMLFNGLSIEIKSKEKVGLVGYSGSGKTTFCNLILRLYDVNFGEILMDGQNIAKITQQSLHNAISVVPQDPILFHRSIMENIKYGNVDSSFDALKLAIRKAYIAELVEEKGGDFNVGEHGNMLSKGQRQRIVIARAILKNAPILFLDEATSSLDYISEQAIQKSLNEIMGNKTAIVIAHRLSTLLQMDRILVFDNGKIVEDGQHEGLLKNRGIYYKLWSTQKDGFIAVNMV